MGVAAARIEFRGQARGTLTRGLHGIFLMYAFFVRLLQPHTLLFLLICWALFRLWYRRNAPPRRLWPLMVPLFALAALSTPAAAYLAEWSLEAGTSPLEERPADAEAIVVLSSGVYPPDGPRRRAEMDESTLHRCLEGARLYHQGAPCLVVASGGKVDPDTAGPPFAAVMGELLGHLGVKDSDLVLEENSRTTYENAVECGKRLNERQVHRIVLVADAVDMKRADACLRKQGFQVIPAPCHYRATHFGLALFTFVPSPEAAVQVQRVWHEWLGLVWYWCKGRI
jgi:uncharacterized SAM-binding protein YcdF (DUF218 family)